MAHVESTKISCLNFLIVVVAFFAALFLFTPTFPTAFAHGGHQLPAADFEGKKDSLFVKLDPPVVTDISQPIFINARFFDENTNQNFEEVTYRIFFQKNGTRSEEHTSELQSRQYLVCRLLLEKKKKQK